MSTFLFLLYLSAKNCINFNVSMIISNVRKAKSGIRSFKYLQNSQQKPNGENELSEAKLTCPVSCPGFCQLPHEVVHVRDKGEMQVVVFPAGAGLEGWHIYNCSHKILQKSTFSMSVNLGRSRIPRWPFGSHLLASAKGRMSTEHSCWSTLLGRVCQPAQQLISCWFVLSYLQ